jgi:RimJ/RimL family protein N-acetyltransferase
MPIFLETNRLVLRPLSKEDMVPFLAYRNDPQVYIYQGWKVPYLREQAEDFIFHNSSFKTVPVGEWLQLAIIPKNSDNISKPVMIGDIAFHITRSNPRLAYIGYTLERSAWGKGYAREAAQAVLDYLFRVENMHRVIADCDVMNLSSVRLLERLGFRREAHYLESYWMESSQSWGSEYLYALLQREWLLR